MKKIVIVVAGIFLVSGCGTPGQSGSQEQNAAAGAAIGALLGCGLASMMGEKCAKGALLGGAAGAAIGWSYESRKVASANDVNAQARRAGVYVPNNKVVVGRYNIVPDSKSVVPGTPIVTESNIQLIGNSNRVPQVEESLVLVDPDGNKSPPNIAKVQAVDGAGFYKSKAKFPIPQNFPQGNYTIESALSLDGQVVGNDKFNVQVAIVDGNQVVRFASAE